MLNVKSCNSNQEGTILLDPVTALLDIFIEERKKFLHIHLSDYTFLFVFLLSSFFSFLFFPNGNCLTVKKNIKKNKGHWLPGITKEQSIREPG